jgi:protocatechuate 3,4-dioxygenase beta subunit
MEGFLSQRIKGTPKRPANLEATHF